MSLRIELAMREKKDGGGQAYLFAPIPLINMVVFVFDEPDRGGVKRAKLVLKPYEGKGSEFQASWEEEDGKSSSSLPYQRRG